MIGFPLIGDPLRGPRDGFVTEKSCVLFWVSRRASTFRVLVVTHLVTWTVVVSIDKRRIITSL